MAEVLYRRFFEEDKPHGYVKRIMYKKHLQAFVPVSQQATPKRYRALIIDGFAGPGRYSDNWPTDIEKYGSPIVALMVALNFFFRCENKKLGGKAVDKEWNLQEYYAKNNLEDALAHVRHLTVNFIKLAKMNPFVLLPQMAKEDKVSLIFVEKERENVVRLQENICAVLIYFFQDWREKIVVRDFGDLIFIQIKDEHYAISCSVINANFVDFTRKCWKDGVNFVDDSTLCTTFVDPFGYTHTPMKELQAYTGPRKSLLINFMSSYINRFVSRNAEGVARCYGIEDCLKVAQLFRVECRDMALDDAVTEFVKYVIRSCNDERASCSNIVHCTENYEKVLRDRAGSDMSLTFEMRGKTNGIIYHLVYITNHMMQLTSMKEAMNRGTQHSDELKLSDFEVVRKGHRLNLGNLQDHERVAEAIFTKFRGCQNVQIEAIERFILMDTPYVFRIEPLARMVREKKDPRITNVCDFRGVPPQRRGTSFPKDTITKRRQWFITFRE